MFYVFDHYSPSCNIFVGMVIDLSHGVAEWRHGIEGGGQEPVLPSFLSRALTSSAEKYTERASSCAPLQSLSLFPICPSSPPPYCQTLQSAHETLEGIHVIFLMMLMLLVRLMV